MSVYVEDLKSETDLPHDFLDCLPAVCPYCGSKTEITESLSKLSCSNSFCVQKEAERLAALVKDLGILDLGEKIAFKIMTEYGSNPYLIFGYNPEEDGVLYTGASVAYSQHIYEQVCKHRKMSLPEYLKYGNIPGVRDSANHLLSGYTDLREFYKDLESGGVSFVQGKLGIHGKQCSESSLGTPEISEDLYDYLRLKGRTDSEIEEINTVLHSDEDEADVQEVVSARAAKIYQNLMLYKNEVFQYIKYVDIQVTSKTVNICISKAVGAPYTSKSDFVTAINNEYGDRVHVTWLSSVTKNCDYLIWSKTGAPTSKVVKAQRYIDDGVSDIKIVTGIEFKNILESMVKGVEPLASVDYSDVTLATGGNISDSGMSDTGLNYTGSMQPVGNSAIDASDKSVLMNGAEITDDDIYQDEDEGFEEDNIGEESGVNAFDIAELDIDDSDIDESDEDDAI